MDITIFLTLAALLPAYCAWLYAIREIRRNNEPDIRLRECNAPFRDAPDVYSKGPFNSFVILIKNCGIPLHQVQTVLVFSEAGGGGNFQIPFSIYNSTYDNGQFAKGMIAEFELRSYDMHPSSKGMLKLIDDPKKQNARIVIFSQGYRVWTFPIGNRRDKWKHRWNCFATSVYLWTRYTKTNDAGRPIGYAWINLPKFDSQIGFQFDSFRRNLDAEESHAYEHAKGHTTGSNCFGGPQPRSPFGEKLAAKNITTDASDSQPDEII